MEKPQTLADYLGVQDPVEPGLPTEAEALLDLSGKDFAKQVLESREFRKYIVNGFTLGDIPPAIVTRLMDYYWGKPVERVEVRDRSDLLENISEEAVAAKLERVQRLLRLIQSARGSEDSASEDDDAKPTAAVH